MSLPIFETERLILEPLGEKHWELHVSMNTSEEVMQYLFGPSDKDKLKKEWARYMKFQNNNDPYGFWAMRIKENNQIIGWQLLKKLDDREDIEIGYRLDKAYWGKGYATEAARRILEYGLESLNLNAIVGVTHLENLPSQKVLEKIGLSYKCDSIYHGIEVKYFEIVKDQ